MNRTQYVTVIFRGLVSHTLLFLSTSL